MSKLQSISGVERKQSNIFKWALYCWQRTAFVCIDSACETLAGFLRLWYCWLHKMVSEKAHWLFNWYFDALMTRQKYIWGVRGLEIWKKLFFSHSMTKPISFREESASIVRKYVVDEGTWCRTKLVTCFMNTSSIWLSIEPFSAHLMTASSGIQLGRWKRLHTATTFLV